MSEQQLILTRGIPASGKSTYAMKWVMEDLQNRVRVNRDDIRFELYKKYVLLNEKGETDRNAEGRVTQVEQKRIRQALKEGKSVIVDNTNLSPRIVNTYQKMAKDAKVTFAHKDFPITMQEALKRNAARDRVVPPEVIERMYKQLGPNGEFHHVDGTYPPRPFVKPEKREAGLIVDLDGTICDVRGIRHFVRGKHRNFDMFHRSSLFCPPNEQVLQMVRDAEAHGIPIIIISARQEKYREVSEVWLNNIEVDFSNMYLRPDDDLRPDHEVKHDILKKVREDYDILRAIDDNPTLKTTWAKNKIQTTMVPGFTEEEIAVIGETNTIQIDNPFSRGGCIRCGRPLKNGGILGPTCAKF